MRAAQPANHRVCACAPDPPLRLVLACVPHNRSTQAHHAGREDASRRAKALNELMSSDRAFGEARRGFTSSTEAKVRAAVEDRLKVVQRSSVTTDELEPAAQSAQSGGAAGDGGASFSRAPAGGAETSAAAAENSLVQQRRALMSANFEDEAHQLSVIIAQQRGDAERRKLDLEQVRTTHAGLSTPRPLACTPFALPPPCLFFCPFVLAAANPYQRRPTFDTPTLLCLLRSG